MINFESREQITEKLRELKAKNLPKMTWDLFQKRYGLTYKDLDVKEVEALDDYLSHFADVTNTTCIFSDEAPELQMALSHGMAIDKNTGLSWRVVHYLTIKGKEIRFDKVLQYHPDDYSIGIPEEDEE